MTLTPQLEIILIASAVAVACAIPGVFLVLRQMSMMSDAISHAILLGIVLAFFYVKNLSSPFLLIGAAATGVVTVTLTELIFHTKKVKEDASIGLVFPFLFSIAILLINLFAGQVHIDTDAVLLGELAFAPFNRLVFWGINLPHALWLIGAILMVNLIFVALFYKELKLATFDPGLAGVLGFSPIFIHYMLMIMVSITAVGSFDAVGAVLVVALMITPPATAYLLTNSLSRMLVLSGFFGILSALAGYGVAHWFDASIAGSMAAMSGLLFLVVLLAAPHRGLVVQLLRHRRQKMQFAVEMLLVHLLHHEQTAIEKRENTFSDVKRHMKWSDIFRSRVIASAVQKNLVTFSNDRLFLTAAGRRAAVVVMRRT